MRYLAICNGLSATRGAESRDSKLSAQADLHRYSSARMQEAEERLVGRSCDRRAVCEPAGARQGPHRLTRAGAHDDALSPFPRCSLPTNSIVAVWTRHPDRPRRIRAFYLYLALSRSAAPGCAHAPSSQQPARQSARASAASNAACLGPFPWLRMASG